MYNFKKVINNIIIFTIFLKFNKDNEYSKYSMDIVNIV